MTDKENNIYLDYAASTPVDDRVFEVMKPYFSEKFGNPGSLHEFGQEAVKGIDFAREKVAETIGADFREIIFTGSATESDNMAVRGVVKRAISENSFEDRPRIIVSEIEHEAVLETAKDLENRGVDVVYAPVDEQGFVDPKFIKKNLTDNTVLVSVMYANNEIGTIQPIKEIAEIIDNFKEDSVYPMFHTDAVQALQFLDCNVEKLGVDMMTFSGHKIYAPKGIGVLYINRESFRPNKLPIDPTITGGGQEFGLRSGTQNTPLIVGLGKAIELIQENKQKEKERIEDLKNTFLSNIQKEISGVKVNGSGKKIPNILNLYFPDLSSENLLIKLDMAGIAVSSGAACGARSTKQSHVLKAMGFSSERVDSSLRFSFGRPTTKQEIEKASEIIKNVIQEK